MRFFFNFECNVLGGFQTPTRRNIEEINGTNGIIPFEMSPQKVESNEAGITGSKSAPAEMGRSFKNRLHVRACLSPNGSRKNQGESGKNQSQPNSSNETVFKTFPHVSHLHCQPLCLAMISI